MPPETGAVVTLTHARKSHDPTRPDIPQGYLGGTKVTGRGLEQIKPLTNLRLLNLSSTKIGNADLESLTKMTRLENLVLDDTSVTDGCLQHLLDLPELREVTFANTLVTPFGFKQFQVEWQRRRNAAGVDKQTSGTIAGAACRRS